MEETGAVDNREKEIKKERKPWIGEEASQKLFFILLLLIILLSPGTRIISDILPLEDYMIVQSIYMLCVFGLFSVILIFEHIAHRIPWKKYKVAYACLIVMWLFSFLRSLDAPIPKIAFLGNGYRAEGLLQIGGYYVIFFVATLLTNKKYRSILLQVILFLGTVISIIGLLQYLKIYSFWGSFSGMASFGFGNPNFYSTFAIMFAGIAMAGFWLYEEESDVFHPYTWWKKGIWFIFSIFSFIACLASRCVVSYVGIIMMFLLMIFLAIVGKKKRYIRILIMIVSFLFVMFLLNSLSDGRVYAEFTKTFQEIEQEGSVFGDSVGTNRMKKWKEIVALLPTYWLYGCGIEHLGYVHLFTYGLGSEFEIVDKAHNEYLDLWVTRGIVVIVFYLFFLFALFIPGIMQYIKKKCYETDDIKLVLIFPFFGYIAQAFFNISILPVAPIFWLICGLLVMGKTSEEECKELFGESEEEAIISIIKEE